MVAKEEELEAFRMDLEARPELDRLPRRRVGEGFPAAGALQATFHEIWARVEERLDVRLTSEEALRLFPHLVVYDIPDGTRSTLTVERDVDVGLDAALYCVALVHTLKALGAQDAVIMTHTVHNRQRGEEGFDRILRLLSTGVRTVAEYAEHEEVNLQVIGMGQNYELQTRLSRYLPPVQPNRFNAHFLVDYQETPDPGSAAAEEMAALPEIDVCVRHTKLNMSGGWVPGKLLHSTFLYSQNGTLFSNWSFDELVALSTLALVAKLLHSGEGLVKMYGDIDEVKARHQLRELRLFNETVRLRPRPAKLFVLGSPYGLYQFYF